MTRPWPSSYPTVVGKTAWQVSAIFFVSAATCDIMLFREVNIEQHVEKTLHIKIEN
jgi:hypothetical protein